MLLESILHFKLDILRPRFRFCGHFNLVIFWVLGVRTVFYCQIQHIRRGISPQSENFFSRFKLLHVLITPIHKLCKF